MLLFTLLTNTWSFDENIFMNEIPDPFDVTLCRMSQHGILSGRNNYLISLVI